MKQTILPLTHLGAFHTLENFHNLDAYIPEPWLPHSDPSYNSAYAHDNKAIVYPFSIGPRNYVSQHLTIVEMRLILSRLLWNFNLELMPESEGWADQKV
jgi:cytochrome P450